MPIHTSSAHWVLETTQTALAFGLDADGRLVNFYWGEPPEVRVTSPNAGQTRRSAPTGT